MEIIEMFLAILDACLAYLNPKTFGEYHSLRDDFCPPAQMTLLVPLDTPKMHGSIVIEHLSLTYFELNRACQ